MKIPILHPTASLPTIASVVDRTNVFTACLVTGAVLLRGFPDAHDSTCLKTILPAHDFAYVGGAAPRTRVSDGIFTANDAPCDATIPFHHELAHAPKRPTHILFHAMCVSTTGGETVLTDSRRLARYVKQRWPHIASDLDDGVVYRRTIPDVTDSTSPIGRSWQDVFGVTTRVDAERIMAKTRMSWRWSEAGLWTQSPSLPAFRHHPRSGECAFYNSLIAAYTGWNDARNTGSGSILFAKNEQPIPADVVDDVQRVAWEGRYECAWEHGDVLVVDNAITMHARNPFAGNRTIHVRMLTA
jgi:hypothetical protein